MCADIQAKQECLNQGRTWSESSCSCQCPEDLSSLTCSLGDVWSNVSCHCVPEDSLKILASEDRLPRSGTSVAPPFLSWQVITIIILLLLIFILIVTIFALISKLQAAKRRIKTAKLQASARNATHPNNPHQDDTSHLYDLYSPPTNANKDMSVKTDRSSGKH